MNHKNYSVITYGQVCMRTYISGSHVFMHNLSLWDYQSNSPQDIKQETTKTEDIIVQSTVTPAVAVATRFLLLGSQWYPHSDLSVEMGWRNLALEISSPDNLP